MKTNIKHAFFSIILSVLIAACSNNDKASQTQVNLKRVTTLDKNQQEWIERTLSEMSTHELAAQVVMDWYGGNYTPVESDEFDRERKEVEGGTGGIWFMRGGPYDQAAKSNALQKHAKVPLLVTNFEGLGKKLFENAESMVYASASGTDIPPALAYGAIGDPLAVKEAGRIAGKELRAAGNIVVGGPEVNVFLDLDNVLHNRCFGDDPEQIALLSAAYIEGIHEVGALSQTGFFPGAGSIDTDPHIELPIAWDDRQAFDTVHYIPFRASIEAGTDMIMSSHIATPGLTGLDTLPATLSPEVTRILREDLGFDGVLITDAMAMGGITNSYEKFEASILAIKAGNDIILGPPFYFADTLAARVEKGEIPIEQLKTSVRRILELKAKVGLHEETMVNLDDLNTVVGCRSHQMKADSAAFRSIVLLRDQQMKVPLNTLITKKVLSISYERKNPINEIIPVGREFNGILRQHIDWVKAVRVSPESDASIYQDLRKRSENMDQVIISVYLRPALGVSIQDTISESLIGFVEDLRSEGKEVIVVSFGELRVLDDLPELGTFMLAWSPQGVMQRAAAKAILGISPISGHLPINLPPFHNRGEGLARESAR